MKLEIPIEASLSYENEISNSDKNQFNKDVGRLRAAFYNNFYFIDKKNPSAGELLRYLAAQSPHEKKI